MDVIRPQQARSERTLERILDACDRLLRDRTFDDLSIQEIAREANVSVGNLYNRFSDKEALITHVIERHQQRGFELLQSLLKEARSDSGLKERLLTLANAIAEVVADLRPVFAAIVVRVNRQHPMAASTSNNSDAFIDFATEWLMARASEITPGEQHERCRFVAAQMAYVIQFDVLMGTPRRMFGNDYITLLVDQSFSYLTRITENTR